MKRSSVVVVGMVVLVNLTCRTTRGPGVPGAGAPNDPAAAVDPADVPGELPPHETPGRALSAAELAAVVARLPALAVESQDEQDFAVRDRSLPPPRTGTTVAEVFPPPPRPAPDAQTPRALEVLRFAPEGDVALVPQLSVTFNQPMVELTAIQELAGRGVPVKLTPAPPGKWRWAGTKTLLFEPMTDQGGEIGARPVPQPTRFPAATKYTVEIPAGTRSAVGGTLAQGKTWSFATPAAKIAQAHPTGGPQRRDGLLFVKFDQRIDPGAVLATITVAGRDGSALRLATDKEITADETVAALVAEAAREIATRGKPRADKPRWLAFRPVAPLPADQAIEVRVGPGTPSAEGPRLTDAVQRFGFRTYGPMVALRHMCSNESASPKRCRPLDPLLIQFSNPIDARRFAPGMVKASPEIPGLKAEVSGDHLVINGLTRGRVTYQITVAASLPDQFGQTLGKAQTFSFETTSATPMFAGADAPFHVLDPAAKGKLPIYTVNHRAAYVRLYAVTPADWRAYLRFRELRFGGRRADDANGPRVPPGKLVFDRAVPIAGAADELRETAIDLGPALRGGLGHVVAWIAPKPIGDQIERGPSWAPEEALVWLQSTQIGLTAFFDATDLSVWATSLGDGKPLAGVDVTLAPSGPGGKTGADGLATLRLGGDDQPAEVLVARRGNDSAILPKNIYGRDGWYRRELQGRIAWYVFDDRHMYRPGEEVRWKGWLRRFDAGKGGDLDGFAAVGAKQVHWELRDARNNKIAAGELTPGVLGGFDGQVKLPGTMNLGPATLQLVARGSKLEGETYQHRFEVQEFRRPEFEVTATSTPGPLFVGDTASATVTAAYYAGGGLPGAEVSWNVTRQITNYRPPGHDGYTFGTWEPWWTRRSSGAGAHAHHESGRTNGSGVHSISFALAGETPPRPIAYQAEASVMDVNRQRWTARTNLLAHPADRYVGLRSPRLFVDRGQPIHVDAIVTDLDGKRATGTPIAVTAVRVDWVQKEGEYRREELDPQSCHLVAADSPQRCSFKTPEGGEYKLRATVADGKQRTNQSELTLWVSGGKHPPARALKQEAVTLIPDKQSYAAGETAEILVLAPFAPAEGVLSVRRSGLVELRRFSLAAGSTTVKVPIVEGYVPNVTIEVDLVGAAVRVDDAGTPLPAAPRRPAFASGAIDLAVPPRARTLALAVTPAARKLAPGAATTIALAVKDAAGQPAAGAEIAVVVVDEAVLALSGYELPDPLALFYAPRPAGASAHHLRGHVLLGNPRKLAAPTGAAGPAAGAPMRELRARANRAFAPPAPAPSYPAEKKAKEDADAPIAVRTDFNALALFAPRVTSDADGRAEVSLKLPDNLTRYRVMAVAVHGERAFGSGDATITARLPLMVRPSAPRFLNFGDKFALPVVLQNQTDQAFDADVVVRAGNALMLGGGAANTVGRRVHVPPNDRVEVRFPAAAVMAGTARFQIGGVAAGFADAADVVLPVWTPATTEAFATYGEIDAGAIAQPVATPAAVFPQFGGLEITTSSTELQALTDAVLYLVSYRFECAEQLASRVLAVAALKDVLAAFKAKDLPPPEKIIAAVKRDLKRLEGLQSDSGGFGFWRRDERDDFPFLTVHVMHALARAKGKGFEVPAAMLQRGHDYLKAIERHIPAHYPAEVRTPVIAYALYVRNRLGDRDAQRAGELLQAGPERLGMETVAWLYSVVSGDKGSASATARIRRHLANRVSEEAGTAHFTTSYGDRGYLLLASARRVDGILLEALIGDQPASDLIPKLVRGLLAHRTAGRWESTQESAWVLLGLDRYFQAFEKVVPDFTARTWLGATFAGEHAFKGRTTERSHIAVPMAKLAAITGAGTERLTLAKEGPGRLYYRVGLQYAPKDLDLPPAEHGFSVQREYEGVDAKDDVRLDAQGIWHVKAGATVRVRLTMVAEARRYHVALTDPLPAGLEAMNPALAVTGTVPQDPKQQGNTRYWHWFAPWYEHQNLRDERAEAFTPLLWEGTYTYSYLARATTPGNFVVPPAKAEEMYHPETFGRSGGDRVIVE